MCFVTGIGIDMVEVQALDTTLRRTPALGPRLFSPTELNQSIESLAGRFAAKEALAKALGGGDLPWNDVEVVSSASGAPRFALCRLVRIRADELGVTHVHISITHDGGYAAAVVVLVARNPSTKQAMPVSNDGERRPAQGPCVNAHRKPLTCANDVRTHPNEVVEGS